jgi:hypothetical protein
VSAGEEDLDLQQFDLPRLLGRDTLLLYLSGGQTIIVGVVLCSAFQIITMASSTHKAHHESMVEKVEEVEAEKIAILDAGHLPTHEDDLDENERKLERRTT